jgi:hypothetical protein
MYQTGVSGFVLQDFFTRMLTVFRRNLLECTAQRLLQTDCSATAGPSRVMSLKKTSGIFTKLRYEYPVNKHHFTFVIVNILPAVSDYWQNTYVQRILEVEMTLQ